MPKPINEEMHLEEEWFNQARKQTVETLATFINHLMNDYRHDYGTVCHAIAACAIAGMCAADNTDNGGISGFQAGFVMWDFIRQTNYLGNKCGMRIINYDDLLYPQYKYKFEKTLSRDTWNAIQEQAKKNLEEKESAHPSVIRHWQSIVDGTIPPFGFVVEEDKE